MRILVVEDDVRLARRIGSALAAAGHDPMIAHSGERALDAATETSFDLIVLDITLPGVDGFEVLRHLCSQDIPSRVLILTARDDVKDRVTGLELGADDCLPKPFAMRELAARVNALGRRYPEEPTLDLRAADLALDLFNHQIYRGSRRIKLSVRELMLLKVLMREPGRVFTRTELYERVWEVEHEYGAKLVEVFIGRLRRKIGDPPLILTVRHLGYTIGCRPCLLRYSTAAHHARNAPKRP
jgi:DNA-binding response OmpR family regulator